MIKAIWMSLLALCLMSGRGFLADLVAQTVTGLAVGICLAQAARRAYCWLDEDRNARAVLAFYPLLLFGFHFYLLWSLPGSMFWLAFLLGPLIGFVGWALYMFTKRCEHLDEHMDDVIIHVSSAGG